MDGFDIGLIAFCSFLCGYCFCGLIEHLNGLRLVKRYERIFTTYRTLLKEASRVNDELWEELSKRSEK